MQYIMKIGKTGFYEQCLDISSTQTKFSQNNLDVHFPFFKSNILLLYTHILYGNATQTPFILFGDLSRLTIINKV